MIMSKLVFFPSDPIEAYIKKGRDYKFLDEYYNPGGFFDEVICISPWGDKEDETISRIRYIKSSPYKFKTIIKSLKPDVVRGYGGYCCADWISFNKVKGIPTIVSVHDTNPELIHDSLSYADSIICMSQAVKKAVLELVPNVTENIYVMPNRIDVELYSRKNDIVKFDELNSMFPGKYHILHVGRKVDQKNLDTVIKAMKYLGDDVVTVFVGQGDAERFKELARKEGVHKRCYFVDRVESKELPYWYSWCDCMCTPSRWEGFGYVFIEAAACEAAIVTANIAPMNEYLNNGINAILVDEYENPVKIADAIKKCLSNDDEIKTMKNKAREVGYCFSKDDVDRQEIEIYKEVIKSKPNNKINNILKFRMIFQEKYNSFIRYIKSALRPIKRGLRRLLKRKR